MARTELAALAVVALAALTVGGCKPKPGAAGASAPAPTAPDAPTKAQQASLLTPAALALPCTMNQLQAGDNDSNGLDQARAIDAWITAHLENNPSYPSLGQSRQGPGWTDNVPGDWRQLDQTFNDPEGARTYQILAHKNWGTVQAPGVTNGVQNHRDYENASVSFCSFVPRDVQILDSNLDPSGKLMSVTYSVGWRPTDFALLVDKTGLQGVSGMATPANQERNATLRKLDATGWRVESN